MAPKAKEGMVGKTCNFGTSLMIEAMLRGLEGAGYFEKGKEKLPQGEIVPSPKEHQAVVFKNFFTCGLRLPASPFVRDVLDTFKVQLHQLTPNGILNLSKFCWACYSYGVQLNLDTFCKSRSSRIRLAALRSMLSMGVVPSCPDVSKMGRSWKFLYARRTNRIRIGQAIGSMWEPTALFTQRRTAAKWRAILLPPSWVPYKLCLVSIHPKR